MVIENRTYFMIGAGVAAVILAALVLRKAGGVVVDAAQAVNPLNNENVFYSGVNSAGAAITGDKDWSLGGAIYDATHVGQNDELSILSGDGIRHIVFGDKDKTIFDIFD